MERQTTHIKPKNDINKSTENKSYPHSTVFKGGPGKVEGEARGQLHDGTTTSKQWRGIEAEQNKETCNKRDASILGTTRFIGGGGGGYIKNNV